MTATMRAVAIKGGKGAVDQLYINPDTPMPRPSGSQALVRIKAFGLNRMDILQREGLYPVPPQAPSTLGVEFSGTIVSLPSDCVSAFRVGAEVFGLAYGGAYAEYIAVSTHMLIAKPAGLSWEEAAGIPEVYLTALQAMYMIGEFAPGKSILWHAGASGVSIAGQQLSKLNGAKEIYATARSEEKCEFLVKEFGITAAFNSTTTKWDEEILRATDGRGVDIIVDFIGPDTFAGNLHAAARDGRIVNLAVLGGIKFQPSAAADVDLSAFVRKRIRYEGSSLRSRDEAYQVRLKDQFVEHALPAFRDGRLKSVVEKIYPWEEIQEAQRQMEANLTKGKLICTIS